MISLNAIPEKVLLIILGCVVALILILAIILIVRKRKSVEYYYEDKNGLTRDKIMTGGFGAEIRDSRDGHTVLRRSAGRTDYPSDKSALVTLRGDKERVGLYQFTVSEEAVTLGRDRSKSQVVINGDKGISGLHCTMSLKNGNLMVEDRGSTNGTWVEENKISAPMILNNGDHIRIGSSSFRVEIR